MSGCVAVTCAETARYSLFASALANLEKPEGTQVRFAVGSDREQGRNTLALAMLEAGDEWLLFLDDDQIFGADLLTRLLGHDMPVVGGLYLRRDKPWTPVAYSGKTNGKWEPLQLGRNGKVHLLTNGDAAVLSGLTKVAAVGAGGLLIRREVFEAYPHPWFIRDEETEDLIFCETINQQYPIYVDLDAPLGHMTVTAVWPTRQDDGRWMIGFDVAGQVTFVTDAPA